MTRRAFEKRQQLMATGLCPRCAKPVDPWPLRRADVCHVAGSVVCGRLWNNIRAAEQQLTVKG